MTRQNSQERAARVKMAGLGTSSGGWFHFKAGKTAVRKISHLLDGRLQKGRLTIEFPNADTRTFEGTENGPDAHICIHKWRAVRRLLFGGSLGFANSYIAGDWTSPDLVSVIELAARNRTSLNNSLRGSGFLKTLKRMKHALRANTKIGSKRNISFHYDLGNAFYAEWLDPTMTYSSAWFGKGAKTLEEAQKDKYRRLLDILEVKPDDHILEIGCGWGGFAELAAKERDVKVTGLTLSEKQLQFAQKRIQKAGLEDKVTLQLVDYRDIRETFDHVVSIEMFEAVGQEYWQTYFDTIKAVLKPGGKAALQIITIDDDLFDDYAKDVDFIQTYIFPGGMLPSVEKFKIHVKKAALHWQSMECFAQDYARTLKTWRQNFESAFEGKKLPKGFDEVFRRIWVYYLAYCEGGFRGSSINVCQILLSNKNEQVRPAAR